MTPVSQCLKLVELDYEKNGHRSIKHVRNSIKHLADRLGPKDAETLTVVDVDEHIVRRKKDGAQNSSINRELSTLRRALRLARRRKLITNEVHIEMLDESANVREGFAEWDEFTTVKSHLIGKYRRPYIFGYYKGWRMSEILSLPREWVDLELGFVRLPGRISKNKKSRLVSIIEDEVFAAVREAFEISVETRSPYLFCHEDGSRIARSTYYRFTKRAFVAAGYPERNFHDLRRTAFRNVVRAGNNYKLAMQTTGHKTMAVAMRYDIIDPEDMVQAARKVQEYFAKKHDSTSRELVSRVTSARESVPDAGSVGTSNKNAGFSSKLVKSFKKLFKGGRS